MTQYQPAQNGHRINNFRKPKRITITIPQGVHERLEQLSHEGGRSLSNLAAFLLEQSTQKEP